MQPELGLRLWKGWRLYPVAGSLATLVVHFATGLGWGLSALASFVGWPLVGTMVTADDDLPGGWSNPDGTITPPWRTALFWGQLSTGGAISALSGALESRFRERPWGGFAITGLAAGTLAFVLQRRSQR